MSLRTVHVPQGFGERSMAVEARVSRPVTRCLHFPQFAQAQRGDEERLHPHGQLSRARVMKRLGKELGLKKLNFQVLRRTIATLAQTKGSVKDVQGVLGHSKPDITANVYMQQIESGVRQTLDAIYSELVAKSEVAAVA